MKLSEAATRYRRFYLRLASEKSLDACFYMECLRHERVMDDWAMYEDGRAFRLRAWILREVFGEHQSALR